MKRVGLILLSACLLQACQTRTDLAPVYSANQEDLLNVPVHEQAKQAQTTYEVLPGENLYTIAKRFGLNYHELADLNGIEKPYYIHAGQVLLISKYKKLKKAEQAPEAQRFEFHAGAIEPAIVAQPTKAATLHPPLPMATSADWIWPVRQGYVAKPYSSQNKGMDIGVMNQQQVVAARAGSVVYSGVNLTGSDDLIILKHADGFITAYSGKIEVVVHEGQQLDSGQKLATIEPDTQGGLHFDLRKGGNSLNPNVYVTEKS